MSGARVVVVAEPHRDLATFFGALLESNGLRATMVSSGEEALAAVERERPDAVVIDLAALGRDPLTLLRKLRTHPRHADVPVVVTTGFPMDHPEVAQVRTLADRVLLKPIGVDLVLATLALIGR